MTAEMVSVQRYGRNLAAAGIYGSEDPSGDRAERPVHTAIPLLLDTQRPWIPPDLHGLLRPWFLILIWPAKLLGYAFCRLLPIKRQPLQQWFIIGL